MMKRKRLFPLIAALGIMSSCADTEDHSAEQHKNHSVEESEVSVSGTSATIADQDLNAVYPHYLSLSEALVVEDAAKAQLSANAIVAGTASNTSFTQIHNAAKKISESKDIKEQRTIFSDLSNELIEKTKSSGLRDGEIFVEFCPMAFNDKGGYWLSDKKTIRNPYYGDEMLACGSVVETLKNNK